MSIYEYDEVQHIAQEKEDSWTDGLNLGKVKNQVELIRNNMNIQVPLEQIARFLGIENEYIENIIKLMQLHPEESDEEIAKRV